MIDLEDVASAEHCYNEALRTSKEDGSADAVVFDLLLKSSKLGSAQAKYALASWYLHGKYVKKDIRTGTKLLFESVRLGSADACFDLAVSYETGVGVKKDIERAFELYMESALRGDIQANYSLYRCFWHGIGVRKNRNIARLWRQIHRTKLK